MSVSKRKQTKSRGKKRGVHQKLVVKKIATCTKCSKPVLSHHACKFCGTYNGKKVLNTNLDKNTKTATK